MEKFNPFPSYIEIPTATIKEDEKEFNNLDWEQIRESWVELAFALAREARENHNEKRFSLWINRLEHLINISEYWKVRLFYEKCLFFLFKLNQEELRKCLESWPQIDNLPFWQAKKASILAELGNLKEAEKIAEKSLQKIRFQIEPYEVDCLTLSQEGCVMFLLKRIKMNTNRKTNNYLEDIVREYRDRWDKLEIYRCNPDSYIDSLRLSIEKIQLSRFETEIRYQSQSFKDSLSAFSFLRMFEEMGLPVRCGSISIEPNTVFKSSMQIEPYAPFWALSYMIRTGIIDGIRRRFTQFKLSLLSIEEVGLLYELFTNSLKQSTKYLELNPFECHRNSYSVKQIELTSEMLSRLCMRLSVIQLDQLFKLTVDMYQMQIFRKYHFLYSCLNNIMNMLLYSMPQSKIIEKMSDLLSFPIPTENKKKWEEPLSRVRWIENHELKSSFDRDHWTKPISNLINIVKDGTPESRNVAVLRLKKVYEINGLNSTESKLWADALWRRIDPIKGLPSETTLSDSSFLLLPEIEEGIAKKKFHNYLLSTDFQQLKSPDEYINEWLSGTKSHLWDEKKNEKLEDWSLEEIIYLLDRAIIWWNGKKHCLDENIHSPIDFASYLRVEFTRLVKLLSQVILPRLGLASRDVKVRVKDLLTEMEQYEICTLRAIPMILFIESENYEEILQKIRFGLNSAKKKEVHETTCGLFNWIILGNMGKIPFPPSDLLDELVYRTFSRRQPGLESIIKCVSEIVRINYKIFNEKQSEYLIVALKYLIEETKLPDKKNLYKKENSLFSIDELTMYRRLSAELSFWIFQKLKNEGNAVPPIVMDWKETV